MKPILRVLLSEKGDAYYVRSLDQDYHTKDGFLSKEQLINAKPGARVEGNMGRAFIVLEPSFADKYARIGRGPQIIPLKDLGLIVARTGLGKDSTVIDAGSGSGAAACFFANVCKKVVSYELRDDFHKIAVENAQFLELANIEFKHKSVYEGIDETNADVVLFDLPEPWLGVKPAKAALKPGGFLVAYSPTTPQVQDFVAALEAEGGFMVISVSEIIERDWEAQGRKVRPKSQAIGHSGFLVFARKIAD